MKADVKALPHSSMIWGVTFVATTQDICVKDCVKWLGDLKVAGTAHDHRNGKYYIVIEAPVDVCQRAVTFTSETPYQNRTHRKR